MHEYRLNFQSRTVKLASIELSSHPESPPLVLIQFLPGQLGAGGPTVADEHVGSCRLGVCEGGL